MRNTSQEREEGHLSVEQYYDRPCGMYFTHISVAFQVPSNGLDYPTFMERTDPEKES